MRLTPSSLVLAAMTATMAIDGSVPGRWKDIEIKTDGRIGEWAVMTSFKERVSVAAANDGEHLYLAVATDDYQRIRQLAATGLIVWLDVNGGKKETYGIRLPGTGMQERDVRLTYVELLGPKKDDKRRLDVFAETGVAAGAGMNDATLLYELKVPLAPSSEAHPRARRKVAARCPPSPARASRP